MILGLRSYTVALVVQVLHALRSQKMSAQNWVWGNTSPRGKPSEKLLPRGYIRVQQYRGATVFFLRKTLMPPGMKLRIDRGEMGGGGATTL